MQQNISSISNSPPKNSKGAVNIINLGNPNNRIIISPHILSKNTPRKFVVKAKKPDYPLNSRENSMEPKDIFKNVVIHNKSIDYYSEVPSYKFQEKDQRALQSREDTSESNSPSKTLKRTFSRDNSSFHNISIKENKKRPYHLRPIEDKLNLKSNPNIAYEKNEDVVLKTGKSIQDTQEDEQIDFQQIGKSDTNISVQVDKRNEEIRFASNSPQKKKSPMPKSGKLYEKLEDNQNYPNSFPRLDQKERNFEFKILIGKQDLKVDDFLNIIKTNTATPKRYSAKSEPPNPKAFPQMKPESKPNDNVTNIVMETSSNQITNISTISRTSKIEVSAMVNGNKFRGSSEKNDKSSNSFKISPIFNRKSHYTDPKEGIKIAELKKQLLNSPVKPKQFVRTDSISNINQNMVDVGLNDPSLISDDISLNEDDFALEEDEIEESTTTARSIAKRVFLLESIYEGRALTIFFQYPSCCEKFRNITRTISLSYEEEKEFDLKYKSPHILCIIRTMEAAGIKLGSGGNSWNVCWSKPKQDKIKDMKPNQKFNHFPGCWQLGRKDYLWKNVSRLKRHFGAEYDFIPNTYLLSQDFERFSQIRENSEGKGIWIMKPCASACGRGIRLINKKTKLKKKNNYLVSEYISNPHLINGLKYDLRIYVLVSSYDPLRIYLYKEGLVRFATEKYSVNSKKITQKFIHLTNWSVNKHSDNFVKNDTNQDTNASKWNLSYLYKYFKEQNVDFSSIMNKIKDIIIKTLISAEPSMLNNFARMPEHRNNCFELYGFDILLDSNLKPWLMEVNVCPSLNSSSKLDKTVKTSLMCDIMNLIGVHPFYSKKVDEQSKKKNAIPEARKYQTKNINEIYDLNEENCLEKLSTDDWNILFDTDEEFYRRGDFERIFPNKDNIDTYSKFFEFQRYNNHLVWGWMKSKMNFLEKISRKVSNLVV